MRGLMSASHVTLHLLLKKRIDGRSPAAEMHPLNVSRRFLTTLLDDTCPPATYSLQCDAGNVRVEQGATTTPSRDDTDCKSPLHAKPLRHDRAGDHHGHTQSNGKEHALGEVQLPDLITESRQDLAGDNTQCSEYERVSPVVCSREEIAQRSNGQCETQRQ